MLFILLVLDGDEPKVPALDVVVVVAACPVAHERLAADALRGLEVLPELEVFRVVLLQSFKNAAVRSTSIACAS